MIEFLYVFTLTVAIAYFALQLIVMCQAKSMMNLAAYSAARKYAVTYSKSDAEIAAAYYLAPLLPVVGSGDIIFYELDVPDDPGFGRQADLKLTTQFRLMQAPALRRFFGFVSEQTGITQLRTSCSVTME